MSLFIFLMVLQALVAAALVGVVLMQRSEGGGLGVGGSPSGLMSARGAANFLTRTTTFLAILFVALSIVLAIIAAGTSGGAEVDTSLRREVPGAAAPVDPLAVDPLAGVGAAPAEPAPPPAAGQASPAPAADPLQGAAQ